jgi:hypothetical protein
MRNSDGPIQSAFASVVGLPAWSVRRGYGSFVTLEFGETRATPHGHPPRGDGHLWIYCCRWRLLIGGTQIACDESSDAEIDAAVARLEGQPLAGVSNDNGATQFRFSVAVLETWPYDDTEDWPRDGTDTWMFFAPSGNVLTYRADGAHSLEPSDTPPEETVWFAQS